MWLLKNETVDTTSMKRNTTLLKAVFIQSDTQRSALRGVYLRQRKCWNPFVGYKSVPAKARNLAAGAAAAHNVSSQPAAACFLVRRGHALVKLGEPHADPHGVLQELLRAPADARLLLLVQVLAPERVHAVREAPLHQRIVHSQAAQAKTWSFNNFSRFLSNKITNTCISGSSICALTKSQHFLGI